MIRARHGLALLRIGMGALFVISAWDKTTKGWFASGQPLAKTLEQYLPKADGPYQPFLHGTVVPHVDLFAQLVAMGEWVAGVSLLFGLLTRVGAIAGMWLLVNYMLMKGVLLQPQAYLNPLTYSDRLYFLASLTFFLAAAGLVWGLDGALRPVWARIPIVRWLAGIEGIEGIEGAREAKPAYVPAREPVPIAARRPVAETRSKAA
jgi:thiosulfate dehydrogenase [quinone] large subunit